MQHDWIENIVAVIDAGSFARAAERRNITQSAFTRRIEAIERQVGAPLFDRGRKPIVLRPEVRALEAELRALLSRQQRLVQDLRTAARDDGRAPVTLACQHAITSTLSPGLVRRFAAAGWEPVRVRSGNRDECLLLLVSGEADFVVTYAVAGSGPEAGTGFVEHVIGRDRLLPVAVPGLGLDDSGRLPVIGYPPDVFFGEIVERRLLPALPPEVRLRRRAETALTLAAYRYAADGLGVAWLPESLVAADLRAGRLVRPPVADPDQPLDVRLIRLAEPPRAAALAAWDVLAASPGLERLPDPPPHGIEPLGRTEQRDGEPGDP